MRQLLLLIPAALMLQFTASAFAEDVDPAAVDFFEKKIRPVLVQKCYECHSAQAKADGKLKGGLMLDSRQGGTAGGDSGPAVVPGKLDESLLIEAIRYGEDSYKMPPAGKLPDLVIADFEKWIAMGAADPRDGTSLPTARKEIDWEQSRKHWSLQRPQRHDPPNVRNADSAKNGIDRFILARVEAAGLQPAEAADRRTLQRRASVDLCGLPPTLEQQTQFLNDNSDDAVAAMIDRLLDSPQYGERWARHWLDVARYSEDNTNMGPFNGPYPHAWRYRDWVVKALNEDVPYNDFIVRQLATDFLPETGPEDHAALGFQGLAPSYHKEVALAQLVLENRYADEWEDRVDAIGRGLLGLTLACARCHDHKYDAVTVEDYYALAGVFASCRQTTRPVVSDEEIARTQPARDEAAKLEKQVADWKKQLTELPKKIAELEKQLKAQAAKSKSAAGIGAEKLDPDKAQAQLEEIRKQLEQAKTDTAAANAEIAKLKKTPGFEIPLTNALTEEQVRVEEITKEKMKIVYYPDKPRDLNVFVRGDAGRLGPLVQRRFLQVFSDGQPTVFTNGSGRLELARAIVSPENPLTARVLVNRVWMHHFGVGLVDTPSNFGVAGSKPSHPQLLDDLAVRFVETGWSLKWLHREIMLSATYRQSSHSRNSEELQAVDPGNRLLTHFNRRRLDAEALRDSVLAVSGRLDAKIGGPSGDADDANFKRRTIYAGVSRHKLSDTLQTFDFPDPAIHCARRAETTTPLQQMFVLNSPFMKQEAAALAGRIQQHGGSVLVDRVHFVHRLLFGREASDAEVQIAREFLPSKRTQTVDQTGSSADGEAPEFKGARIRSVVKGLGDTYSVEMWIRNTLAYKARPVTGYFFSRGLDQPANDHGDSFGITGTASPTPGRLLFYNGHPHRQSITGKTELAANTWHHVAFVRVADSVALYLNGQLEISGTAKLGYQPGAEQMFVGGRRDNFANFQGRLQEAAIYNRPLTSDEVSASFAASGLPSGEHSHEKYSAAVSKAKPIAYWPLRIDAASSTRATDISGNDHHGEYEQPVESGIQVTLWQRYAHALLSSNEFLYVD
jgi:hypothetical protein